MPTNSFERGSAMVELMMLMIGAAVFLFVVNQKFLHPFSHDEAKWVGWADQIHRHVGHAVCIDRLPRPQTPEGAQPNLVQYFAGTETICGTP